MQTKIKLYIIILYFTEILFTSTETICTSLKEHPPVNKSALSSEYFGIQFSHTCFEAKAVVHWRSAIFPIFMKLEVTPL